MHDFVVSFLTSLAQSYPYLLLACAFIGSIWLARSLVHKARLFTQTVLKEVRGGKAELSEWGADLSELKRELTSWKVDPEVESGVRSDRPGRHDLPPKSVEHRATSRVGEQN